MGDKIEKQSPEVKELAAKTAKEQRQEKSEDVAKNLAIGPNSKVTLKMLGEDIREIQKPTLEDAEKDIHRMIRSSLGFTTKGMSALAAQQVMLNLTEPLTEIKNKWQNERGEAKTYGELLDISEKYKKEVEEVKKFAAAYTEKIAARGAGWIDRAMLLRMQQEAPKIMELIKRRPELRDTALWAMGYLDTGYAEKEKKKHFRILMSELDSPVAWTILNLLSESEKEEFVETYLKTGKVNKVEFFEKGNKFGTFSAVFMEKYIPKTVEKNREKYEEKFQKMNAFNTEAKKVFKKSIGATNAAGEMITFKNIGLLLGKLVALTTVAMNVGVAVSKGEYASIAKNEYVWGGTMGYIGIKAYEGDKPIMKMISTEQVAMRASEAKGNMVDMMNDSNWGGSRGFLGGKVAGARFAFGEFIRETLQENNDKLPKSKMKKENLEEFLKKFSKKNPKYKDLDKKFAKLNVENYEIENWGNIYEELGIEGSEANISSKFDEVYKTAKTLKA